MTDEGLGIGAASGGPGTVVGARSPGAQVSRRGAVEQLPVRLRHALPEGRPLPAETWRRRHRGILVLLWLHAVGIAGYGLIVGAALAHTLVDAGLVALLALLANRAELGQRFRAMAASAGLLTASAGLVHLSGGYIELHFHFFVMIAIIALYHDWAPFLLAIGYVALHHGIAGVLYPEVVYNHPDAWANPWKWAAIHGLFVLGVSAASLVHWRLNEAAQARVESVLDSAGEAIYGLDRHGDVTFVNRRGAQLAGYEARELIGQSLHDLLQPADLDGAPYPREACPVCLAVKVGAAGHVTEALVRSKDGTRVPVEYVSTPIRERGEVVGTVVSCRDVAERKRAEEERLQLARAEAARAAAEVARRRLAWLDEASTALADSLDYEVTLQRVAYLAVPELADWCIVDLVQDDRSVRRLQAAHADPARAELAERLQRQAPLASPDGQHGLPGVLRSGRSELYPDISVAMLAALARDDEHLRVLGELGPRSAMIVPLLAHERTLGGMTLIAAESGRRYGPGDVALAEELARRASLAIDNARLYRQSQEAVRARDEFLSIASHELRTPVTSLKGSAQLLLRGQARGQLAPERLAHGLHAIDEGANRLTALTDDLLDVSRIRTGQLTLRPEPIDLAALVDRLVARRREQLDGRHRLTCELAPPPGPILADPARLEQVLTNLLDNAVKYSPDGGEVRVALRPNADGVLLQVRDDGIGLPPDAAERIFEPFGRAPNAARRNLPGMGLGLYICRQLVEGHGGRIWAESAGDGRGTTICVWLPRAGAAAATEPAPAG